MLPELMVGQLLQLHTFICVPADDTTNVSPNQSSGAASLAALPLRYVGCELFRAAMASCWEHLLSFG